MTKTELIRALSAIAEFQRDCADKAKWAITYPVVRDTRGRNLKQVLTEVGFSDFRSVTENLELAGWIATHGWRSKNGVRGFVLRITEQGRKVLEEYEQQKTKSDKKSETSEVADTKLMEIAKLLVSLLKK